MEQLGLNPAVLDCDPNQPLPSGLTSVDWTKIEGERAPLESHPIYSKYIGMLRVGGVSKDNVMHKMISDGQGMNNVQSSNNANYFRT